MKIIIASSNKHKIEEFSSLLYPHEVFSPQDFNLTYSCVEDGNTFMDNAKIKAKALWQVVQTSGISDVAVLSDDSGLTVEALPHELGIKTARFGCTETKILNSKEKYMLLLEKLKDIPEEKRNAYFTCALYMIYNFSHKEESVSATGICYGKILTSPIGEGGFGYDPVFFCNEANKPMALLGDNKNKYSHRALATRSLLKTLDIKLSKNS